MPGGRLAHDNGRIGTVIRLSPASTVDVGAGLVVAGAVVGTAVRSGARRRERSRATCSTRTPGPGIGMAMVPDRRVGPAGAGHGVVPGLRAGSDHGTAMMVPCEWAIDLLVASSPTTTKL